MAKKHGAKQQKKAAKKKAQRNAKKADLDRRTTKDPSVRLKDAADWPVYEAYRSKTLWSDGIGYIIIARKSSGPRLIVGNFLVDVYCLGVKDALWSPETMDSLRGYLSEIEERVKLEPVSAAYGVKVVRGAVDFAAQYNLAPAPDFKYVKLLLDGIDTSECSEEFTFGKDGKPFYIQGPYDSPEKARSIVAKIEGVGDFLTIETGASPLDLARGFDPEFDDDDELHDDEDFDDEDFDDDSDPDDDIIVG